MPVKTRDFTLVISAQGAAAYANGNTSIAEEDVLCVLHEPVWDLAMTMINRSDDMARVRLQTMRSRGLTLIDGIPAQLYDIKFALGERGVGPDDDSAWNEWAYDVHVLERIVESYNRSGDTQIRLI